MCSPAIMQSLRNLKRKKKSKHHRGSRDKIRTLKPSRDSQTNSRVSKTRPGPSAVSSHCWSMRIYSKRVTRWTFFIWCDVILLPVCLLSLKVFLLLRGLTGHLVISWPARLAPPPPFLPSATLPSQICLDPCPARLTANLWSSWRIFIMAPPPDNTLRNATWWAQSTASHTAASTAPRRSATTSSETLEIVLNLPSIKWAAGCASCAYTKREWAILMNSCSPIE